MRGGETLDTLKPKFRRRYSVLPLDLVPYFPVVRCPYPCVVVGPVDHPIGCSVAVVRAVDVSPRNVVVGVLLPVLDAGTRELPL